jgi:hypothetical protein
MSNITGVIARVVVDDLDAAIPLYQRLSEASEVQRFAFGDVELASVGPFLLLAGNTAAFSNRVATLLVKDLGPVVEAIRAAGGELLDGPAPGPNGDRLIARNPDGAVFEYIQKG